ncbi:hypothetical protein K439DRAFT_605541 [Ramaria rubella]|nr:hypothetical protein K439DRAFT_605541 [Ramaria rubella]
MAAETEDVKPKLNVTVAFDGQTITLHVGETTPFKKYFEAVHLRGKEDPNSRDPTRLRYGRWGSNKCFCGIGLHLSFTRWTPHNISFTARKIHHKRVSIQNCLFCRSTFLLLEI